MKKTRLILKGILALALVLPFMLAGCSNPTNVEYKTVDIEVTYPQNPGGGTPVTVTPTETPEPVARPYGNIGFVIEWPPVKETENYRLWREVKGDPDNRVQVGLIISNIDTNVLQKGYYTVFDVVEFMGDGQTPTLEAGVEYVYTVVAKPHVGTRDTSSGQTAPVSSAIADTSTHIAPLNGSTLKVDGNKRQFVFSFNMGGDFGIEETVEFPGKFTLALFKLNPATKKWDAHTADLTLTTPSSGPAEAKYVIGGKPSVVWTADDAYVWGTTAGAEGEYKVVATFVDGGTTSNYFRTNEQEFTATYKNLFAYDKNSGMVITSPAANFGKVVNWKNKGTVPLIPATGAAEYDYSLDPYVAYFSKDIDITDIVGVNLGGGQYYIDRKVGAADWTESIPLFVRTQTTATRAAQVAWKALKQDAADKLVIDIFGNITPFSVVFDREIPVVAGETKIQYRIRGKDSSGNEDWIALTAMETDIVDPLVGLSMKISANNESSATVSTPLTAYIAKPVVAGINAVDADPTTIVADWDPDLCPTIAGLVSGTEQLVIKYARLLQNEKGMIGFLEDNLPVTFSMDEIQRSLKDADYAKTFWVSNEDLHGRKPEDPAVFAVAQMYLESAKWKNTTVGPDLGKPLGITPFASAAAPAFPLALTSGTDGENAFMDDGGDPKKVNGYKSSIMFDTYYELNYPVYDPDAILFRIEHDGDAALTGGKEFGTETLYKGSGGGSAPTETLTLIFTNFIGSGPTGAPTDTQLGTTFFVETGSGGIYDNTALAFKYIGPSGTVGTAANVTITVTVLKEDFPKFQGNKQVKMMGGDVTPKEYLVRTETIQVARRTPITISLAHDGENGTGGSNDATSAIEVTFSTAVVGEFTAIVAGPAIEQVTIVNPNAPPPTIDVDWSMDDDKGATPATTIDIIGFTRIEGIGPTVSGSDVDITIIGKLYDEEWTESAFSIDIKD